MIERILYSCLTDVSLPNGPGVNERGFLADMLRRFDDRLLAVIPRPSRGLPGELASLKCNFIPAHRSTRTPVGWVEVRALSAGIVANAISAFQPDLVVLRTGAMPIPHVAALRNAAVPYVVKTAGDVTHRAFYGAGGLRRLIRPLNERLFRRLLLGAAFVDVVTDEQKRLLIERFPGMSRRVAVIDNGVDLDTFGRNDLPNVRAALGFRDDEIVIGYVGNLPMQRGGGEVVAAVAALVPRYPVRGLIVGNSGEADQCRRAAEEAGVAGRVIVYGEADFSDVPGLMGAMDIGVSILRPRERSASEQKVRQYLASGLCVVNTEGSNEFLRGQPFARLTSTHDQELVCEAVQSLACLGRQRLEEIGREARAFAEANLSITTRNDKRLELWNETLRGMITPSAGLAGIRNNIGK
jgi:glycosyltransferase involved in cell wall biosynthesis